MRHPLRNLDGTVAAEAGHVSGLLNLATRRLVTRPRPRMADPSAQARTSAP
ncbi:hypothetical protein [Allosalinactinospora lopnorensis]|uniref:hypothetical protein n=1 Tax=Allosalinactinospora lopnorensis TaxID=1352348 RepID=UPI00191C5B6F|nr:hypothetical protein [Allosalinactinospora lopnorensis]